MDFRYSPPWADVSIIGVAGSSGSGKTSLALEIVASLNLPWVVILSMVSLFCILIILRLYRRLTIELD
jgi:uridine kinase